MLAVTPERRGEGLGYLLVETAANKARGEGVRRLYLVTDGAQGYFGEKLGFETIDRKDVDPAIATTARVPDGPLQDRHLDAQDAVSRRSPSRVAAAIIAGGRGRRLGGRRQGPADASTAGRILERQLAVLRPLFARVLLVDRRTAPVPTAEA